MKDLPGPYRFQSPAIYGTSNVGIRTTARAPFHALIWNCVDDKCESVDTFTGLTASRRTQRMLYPRDTFSCTIFRDSIDRFQSRSVRAVVPPDETTGNNNCASFVLRCETISRGLSRSENAGRPSSFTHQLHPAYDLDLGVSGIRNEWFGSMAGKE